MCVRKIQSSRATRSQSPISSILLLSTLQWNKYLFPLLRGFPASILEYSATTVVEFKIYSFGFWAKVNKKTNEIYFKVEENNLKRMGKWPTPISSFFPTRLSSIYVNSSTPVYKILESLLLGVILSIVGVNTFLKYLNTWIIFSFHG